MLNAPYEDLFKRRKSFKNDFKSVWMPPAVPPTNHLGAIQRDFFYSGQSMEPSRRLCKETDCIQTVATSDSAVRNLKKKKKEVRS